MEDSWWDEKADEVQALSDRDNSRVVFQSLKINILNLQLEACSISRCRYLVRLFLPSPAAKSKFWAGPGFIIYCFLSADLAMLECTLSEHSSDTMSTLSNFICCLFNPPHILHEISQYFQNNDKIPVINNKHPHYDHNGNNCNASTFMVWCLSSLTCDLSHILTQCSLYIQTT